MRLDLQSSARSSRAWHVWARDSSPLHRRQRALGTETRVGVPVSSKVGDCMPPQFLARWRVGRARRTRTRHRAARGPRRLTAGEPSSRSRPRARHRRQESNASLRATTRRNSSSAWTHHHAVRTLRRWDLLRLWIHRCVAAVPASGTAIDHEWCRRIGWDSKKSSMSLVALTVFVVGAMTMGEPGQRWSAWRIV